MDYSIQDHVDSWHLWCRLCARSDAKDTINIFVKNEKQTDDTGMMETNDDINKKILNAIEQYFPANMENCDGLPKMLCSNCYNLMKALLNFSEYVKRVQQMFNAIQQATTETASELSVNEIRRIYGITDIYNEHVLVKLPLAEANYIETEPIINATNEDASFASMDTNNPLELLEINFNTKEEENSACSPATKKLTDAEDNYSNGSDEQCQENDGNDNQSQKEDKKNTKLLLGKALKKKEGSTKKPNDTNAAEESLSCSECPCKFKSKQVYENHMKYVHRIKPTCNFTCKQCPRAFKTEHLLKQHLKTHFMCEKCGKMLKSKKSIEKHMLSHSDSSSLKCQICEEVFDYRYRLERHMKIQHSFKPSCKECGLKLSSNEALRRHMLIHTDERPHKCDYCGSAFKLSKSLKVHLLIHSGLKPYSCDFCELTFATGSNCRKHEKTTHAKEFAALVASGGVKRKWHSQEIPKLETLKEIIKNGDNLRTRSSRKSSNFAL